MLDPRCRTFTGLTRYLGAPLPYHDKLVQKLIHSFKYLRAKDIAEPLAKILIDFLDSNNFPNCIHVGRPTSYMYRKRHSNAYTSNCLFAPIPLYNFKERERGFNQAYELARRLGNYYKIRVKKNALIRRKNTAQQADMETKQEREENIAGAFLCSDPEAVRGRIIILIDDVYTTGSTMRECALTLRAAGVKEVWGMTVAKG